MILANKLNLYCIALLLKLVIHLKVNISESMNPSKLNDELFDFPEDGYSPLDSSWRYFQSLFHRYSKFGQTFLISILMIQKSLSNFYRMYY